MALHALVRAVRNGVDWPVLDGHNAADCPFDGVAGHPLDRVAAVFGQLSEGQPVTVAVALCHLPMDVRGEVWARLTSRARAQVVSQLPEVPLVGSVRTRVLAREVGARLARAAKIAATRPSVSPPAGPRSTSSASLTRFCGLSRMRGATWDRFGDSPMHPTI